MVSVLGAERSDPVPGAWAFCRAGEVVFLLGNCPDAMLARKTGDHSYVAYLFTDDVDAVHERAVAAGAEVLKPPTDEWHGMRELLLRMPDGHRLMVGEDRHGR